VYDCPESFTPSWPTAGQRDLRVPVAEAEGLLVLNNGNQSTCAPASTSHASSEERGRPRQGPPFDMWAPMDSQETVGVSPAVFQEFFFPYYMDLAELFGLVYWGCCEPVDPIWENSISRLPNLKAVSSHAGESAVHGGGACRRGIVYSASPTQSPWRGRRSGRGGVGRGDPRDSGDNRRKGHTLVLRRAGRLLMHGNLGKAARAVEIAGREIDRFFPS